MTTNQFPRALRRSAPRAAVCALLIASPLLATPTALAAQATADQPASELSAGLSAGLPASLSATVLPADKTTSTLVKDHVTDDAGILNDDAAAKVVDEVSNSGANLWVVTLKDSSTSAEKWAKTAWKESNFGSTDLLLVINVPDSGINTFYLDGAAKNSVWSTSKRKEVATEIQKHLKKRDFDGAVAAVGSASGSSSSTVGTVALVGGGVAAVGGVMAYRSRRRKQQAGQGAGTGPAQPSIEQLQTQAGTALVETDNAVRSAAEELSYAQAQFGLSATDAFTQALQRAQEEITAAFELRKRLDDDIPETEPQQRAMLSEIIRRCQTAHEQLAAQESEFSKRRGLQANLPTALAETTQRADETASAITEARSILATLQAAYPASALTSVAAAPEQAERLLNAARTALKQAQESVDAGQQGAAVEQVRIAQASIGQAGTLAAQVTSARERLDGATQALQQAIGSISSDLQDVKRLEGKLSAAVLEPLVKDAEAAVAAGRAATGDNQSGDPLAALDQLTQAESALDNALAPAREQEENDKRATVQLTGRLERLNSQVDAVTTYITTNRGAVGSEARTTLSAASRHAASATSYQTSQPTTALAEVAAGERLVAQARSLAEADVRNSSYSAGPWDQGSYGAGYGDRYGRRDSDGIDWGSLILGGILLGGGGDRSSHGSYGGWGSDGGSWGGGSSGGDGFGGGDEGFGGRF
ncbi:TPM domain-containing protein [Actinomyces bovis]|nr:TPM domain-containing protein [Actinomyces bovis]